MWLLEAVSIFLSHPFVIAITAFLLGSYAISKIIPDKKQKVIERIVTIRNLIKEVELVYNRIVFTLRSIKEELASAQSVEQQQAAEDRAKRFLDKPLTEELYRISNLVNDKIQLEKIKLDSEIEIYFNDNKLIEVHERFSEEFKRVSDYIVVEFPEHHNDFQKTFNEITSLDFHKLIESEKSLVNVIKRAKSIRIKTN